jgi:NADH-quinone oxidoreductase subunit L
VAPFLGFLFNIFFGKSIGKTASGVLGTLWLLFRLVLLYFFSDVFQDNSNSII